MMTIQETIHKHMYKALQIRDRGPIFIHTNHNPPHTVCNLHTPTAIIATISKSIFMRILINNQCAVIETTIPSSLTYCWVGRSSLPLVPNKSRKKWRNLNFNLICLVYWYSYTNTSWVSHTMTIDLLEPDSIRKLEYCSNNIITTMLGLLNKQHYGYVLKPDVKHDFDLVQHAVCRFNKTHKCMTS